MKVVAPENLSLVYAIQHAPHHGTGQGLACRLCLGMLAPFALRPGPDTVLLPQGEIWECVAAYLQEDEIFDLGLPKPFAEFLVHGACHAPQPVRSMECAVRVGELRKKILVHGDRFARGDESTLPEPFTTMDITWSRAYGGPKYKFNPLGKGHGPAADGSHPLPNVVASEIALIEDESGKGSVGFAALPPQWPQRRRFLGNVDENWLAERWPGLPADYDPRYACAAPEDQRFKGWFAGGEPIVVHNMHPGKGVLESAVPLLRPRVFVLRAPDGQGGESNLERAELFQELSCRMETLWLFPEREVGVLLFRGCVDTIDEECGDVAAVLLAVEDQREEALSQARYREHCLEVLRPMQAPPEPEPSPVAEAGSKEEGAAPAQVLAAAAVGVPKVEVDPPLEELGPLQEAVSGLEQRVKEFMDKWGVSEEQVEAHLAKSEAELQTSGLEKELGEQAARDTDPELLLQKLEGQLKDLEARNEALLREHGLDSKQVEEWLAEKARTPETSAEEFTERIRELAGREHLPETVRAELNTVLQASLALPGVFAGLRSLADDLHKQAAPEKEDSPPEPEDVVKEEVEERTSEALPPLTTEQGLERYQKRQSLAGFDLTKCEFAGMNLSGADLRGSLLLAVNWKKINLSGADLRGAICHGANLEAANLENALLDEAVLENASLDKVSAGGCKARRAQLQGASLHEADLRQADLAHADLSGADLSRARLRECRAANLRLAGATLQDSLWTKANLSGSRADETTDAEGADFSEADCRDICWGGARLQKAVFDQALLDRADCAKADLQGARLFMVRARKAVFSKANLVGASLEGCNLFKGSLRGANCSGAVIHNANFFGVDLYGCALEVEKLRDVNLKRTLLQPGLLERRGG